ncbi:MAG: adenylate cyclase, partial [Candidatus Eremiobacteraeota bacterium]|nr:adenylate cyclase [Candidatus Eremiobacteraeota bacterium]
YQIALGDVAGARESARAGLRAAQEVRAGLQIAISLQHLALLAALDGDARRGAQLLGYANARYDHLGVQREPAEQWGHDKLSAELRNALSEEEIAELTTEGASWSEGRAVEEALRI